MSTASTTDHTVERRIAITVFAAVTALISIFLLRDARAFVNSAQDELIGHLGASAGFTVAASGTFLAMRRERASLLTILLIGVSITVVAELAQGLVPNRGIELSDIATGFGGVLIAALCIEIVVRNFALLPAQRVHTIVASIASIVLATILMFDLAPETVSGAQPDGDACSLTTIDGRGQRIELGADLTIPNSCLETSAGGLGLFGPDGTNSLNSESVLLSSPLDALTAEIVRTGGITVTTGFTTDGFSNDRRQPGVIVSLRSDNAGEVLLIRTRDDATQVIGPNLLGTYRSLSYTRALEPNTRYELRAELTASELRVFLDGELAATNTVDPEWLAFLADSDAADDLTLYVGNTSSRTLPFHGVIEWVEIDT